MVLLTKALYDEDDEVRRGAVEALSGINVRILDFIKKEHKKKQDIAGNIEGGTRCSRTNSPMLR